MYVLDLDVAQRKQIRKELEEAIREMGHYSEEEVQELVQDGLDSKLSDLADTIDISKYK